MQRACVRLKMSLLSTMWPRLSFRFTELMLWILLAYVPLNDVGIVSPAAVWLAPQTHWGLGPQGPLEANALQGPVEPLAGGPGDYDVPQLFSPQQRELPWTYPEPPVEPESEVREEFQPWRAAMVPQLGLRCGEKKVSIEVNQDLWGNGNLIQPAELTLGGCPHVEHDDRAGVLAYEYELQDCGSQKLTKDGFIIYVFVLQYRPKMSARLPITRTQNTDITVTCSYPQNVVSQQAIRLPAEEN